MISEVTCRIFGKGLRKAIHQLDIGVFPVAVCSLRDIFVHNSKARGLPPEVSWVLSEASLDRLEGTISMGSPSKGFGPQDNPFLRPQMLRVILRGSKQSTFVGFHDQTSPLFVFCAQDDLLKISDRLGSLCHDFQGSG